MNLRKHGFWCALIAFLLVRNSFAQDLAFSQYYHTPFLTNPAAIPHDHFTRIFFNFRNQNLESGDNLTTPMLSLIYPFGLKKNPFPKMNFGFFFY